MPTEFQMPKLGLTMEEGTIVEWLVDDGAEISTGQPVLVIETDKTETEVEAAAAGVLQRTGQPGETFACGDVIGLVLAPGEAPTERSATATAPAPAAPPVETPGAADDARPVAAPAVASAPAATGRIIASPNARRVAAEAGVDIGTVAGTGPGGRITSEDVEDLVAGRSTAAAATTERTAAPAAEASPRIAAASLPVATSTAAAAGGPATAGSVPASVAARQLADLLGVDLAAVAPDPNDGRVTREGVAAHVRALIGGAAATTAGTPTAGRSPTGGSAPAAQEPSETIRLSGMRGTIAKRMYSSLQDSAQLTLTMDADMDAVVADRAARKDAGSAPGFTDYVIAAAARALRDHPRVNSQVTDEGIAVLPDVHVGLAVALDEGLIVPVVRHADQLSLGQLAPETTRLADGARAGTLGPDEVTGGTFSVTALGMFGVDGFTPVINPPNAAILGVGRLRDDIVVVDGSVRTTKRLTMSLTWDHRVIDGAPAAEFTQTICAYLADPSRLV